MVLLFLPSSAGRPVQALGGPPGRGLILLHLHRPLCFSFSSLTTHHCVQPEEDLASTDKAPALVLPLTSCVTLGRCLHLSESLPCGMGMVTGSAAQGV